MHLHKVSEIQKPSFCRLRKIQKANKTCPTCSAFFRLGMDEEPTESLWVRIKGKAGTGDIIVRVSYRPLDQEDRADEALYRQIGAASH